MLRASLSVDRTPSCVKGTVCGEGGSTNSAVARRVKNGGWWGHVIVVAGSHLLFRSRTDRRSKYSPASRWPSSNGDGLGRLPTRGSEPEYSKALVDYRLSQFQQCIKPGLLWLRDERRTRAPEWDPRRDIFCNNKIFEEMAEAWKSEMWLG